MTGSNRKGRAGERELRKTFFNMGFVSLTVPGKWNTENDFDDHVFANAWLQQLYAAECKRVQRERFYVESDQLAALTEFAASFHPDCEPIVCVRWDHDTTWYVSHVSDLERTRTENAVIAPETRDEWPSLREYVIAEFDSMHETDFAEH